MDVDCISDGERTVIGGVMQHIEEAGIHSGDSACVIPPHSLPPAVVDEISRQTRELARELKVKGLMNVQFAVSCERGTMHDWRSPTHLRPGGQPAGQPDGAVRVQGDRRAAGPAGVAGDGRQDAGRAGPVRRTGADALLGQGERLPVQQVPRRGHHFGAGDALDRRGDGHRRQLPDGVRQEPDGGEQRPAACPGMIFISVADRDKAEAAPIARALTEMGYRLVSTRGTAAALRAAGIAVEEVPKIQEGRPNLIDHMKNDEIALVINTPSGKGSRTDEGKIRAAAVAQRRDVHHDDRGGPRGGRGVPGAAAARADGQRVAGSVSAAEGRIRALSDR